MREVTTRTSLRRPARRGRAAAVVAAFAWAVLAWAASGATPAHAQDEIDVEPPLVEHETIAVGVPGEIQEFEATVVDDRELAEVLLFHRFSGEPAFDETPMRQVASSSVFTASVPTSDGETRAIEYYIEARDRAGNRVIKGYAFSPLVRRLGEGAVPDVAARAPDEPGTRTSGNRRWLYIGLGVLAAGALAVALNEDSGTDDDPNTFTLTIDPPR